MLKLPRILQFLMPRIAHYVVDPDAGGAGDAVVDRGDDLVPKTAVKDTAAEDDAAAEVARIQAEKDAQETAAKAGKGSGKDDPDPDADPDDPDADPDKKAEKDGKRADTRVPLKRHKELLEKERERANALAAELAQFKGGDQVAKVNEKIAATETKLIEMETEYTKLMVDGKVQEAAKLMTDIRKLERTISDQKSDMRVAAAEARAVERVRYDRMVERLEEAYPAINPDHEDYDAEQTQDVLDLMEMYKGRGMAPADAIQQAAKKLLKAETVKQEKAVSTDVKVDKDAVTKERKSEAVKRAVETTNKQPASTEKAGVDSDKIGGALTAKAAMEMPYEEFSKLTEPELAKLRGDLL